MDHPALGSTHSSRKRKLLINGRKERSMRKAFDGSMSPSLPNPTLCKSDKHPTRKLNLGVSGQATHLTDLTTKNTKGFGWLRLILTFAIIYTSQPYSSSKKLWVIGVFRLKQT